MPYVVVNTRDIRPAHFGGIAGHSLGTARSDAAPTYCTAHGRVTDAKVAAISIIDAEHLRQHDTSVAVRRPPELARRPAT